MGVSKPLSKELRGMEARFLVYFTTCQTTSQMNKKVDYETQSNYEEIMLKNTILSSIFKKNLRFLRQFFLINYEVP